MLDHNDHEVDSGQEVVEVVVLVGGDVLAFEEGVVALQGLDFFLTFF